MLNVTLLKKTKMAIICAIAVIVASALIASTTYHPYDITVSYSKQQVLTYAYIGENNTETFVDYKVAFYNLTDSNLAVNLSKFYLMLNGEKVSADYLSNAASANKTKPFDAQAMGTDGGYHHTIEFKLIGKYDNAYVNSLKLAYSEPLRIHWIENPQ
jgi:hypothetical protein